MLITVYFSCLGQGIITKWRLNTQGTIYDGEKGRGADNFQKDPIILEVFSKGTVITTYEEVKFEVTDFDKDGKRTGSHTETRIEKDETEFVDRVEYRLIFRGAVWAQWFVQGDAHSYGDTTTIDSPFFTTSMEGGWFKPSLLRSVFYSFSFFVSFTSFILITLSLSSLIFALPLILRAYSTI